MFVTAFTVFLILPFSICGVRSTYLDPALLWWDCLILEKKNMIYIVWINTEIMIIKDDY